MLDPNPAFFEGANRPVENVNWVEAMEFCRRLSQRTKLDYTLPSEAQWEYACRAGSTTPFAFGETLTPDLANYDGNYTYGSGPKGQYRQQTTEVGSFAANGWGLQDMHGNVWEWCLDPWHDSYRGAPADGSAWTAGGGKTWLLRGGSWLNLPRGCRSASRLNIHPGNRYSHLGFRVCCLPQD